jgi:Leucine-rich repeat (LRR) protein
MFAEKRIYFFVILVLLGLIKGLFATSIDLSYSNLNGDSITYLDFQGENLSYALISSIETSHKVKIFIDEGNLSCELEYLNISQNNIDRIDLLFGYNFGVGIFDIKTLFGTQGNKFSGIFACDHETNNLLYRYGIFFRYSTAGEFDYKTFIEYTLITNLNIGYSHQKNFDTLITRAYLKINL